MLKPVTVLCVGGSDSGAGAGIQADIRAVSACGAYATTAITAVTVQNTRGVQDVFPVPSKFIAAQMESVLSDIGADALKTGMLPNRAAVHALVSMILRYRMKNVVVDPVMSAKGGRVMMQTSARKAITDSLLPQAFVVTPNIPEAETLSGVTIRSMADMKQAAVEIVKLGVKNVVIKGGHLPAALRTDCVDLLYDGADFETFSAVRIATGNTHGTGCTFASALAAGLAAGQDMYQAVRHSKNTVTVAIENSLSLGKGHGPVWTGSSLLSTGKRDECLTGLSEALRTLAGATCGFLIPEVSSNFVYARPGAKHEAEVAAFPGRMIRLGESIRVVAFPEFGASQHMAHVILTVMRKFPSCRAAMNIRFSETTIRACKDAGLKVGSFNRANEPRKQQARDGFTLEWGVDKVMKQSVAPPDIIFDTGGWGKEPMIRVLGKDPADVVTKVLAVLECIKMT